MTDYVIRRAEDGVHLEIDGVAYQASTLEVRRGYGQPPAITIWGHTIELGIGDILRYEGWDRPAEPSAATDEGAAGPSRLEHVAVGQVLPPDDLRRLAFDLYRQEHAGVWAGEILTARMVNIAVDWWNGEQPKEIES